MNLHLNSEEFEQLVSIVQEKTNIHRSIIVKDYFVVLFLKELKKNYPEFIFKGGTSLSKCFNIINRFSEDIDLSYYLVDEKITTSKIKYSQKAVKKTIEDLGFEFVNSEDFKSGRKFQKFLVSFEYQEDRKVRDHIIVENSLLTTSFPVVQVNIQSFLTEYLVDQGMDDVIQEYDMYPIEVNAQDMVRTFIDKVYAICDYYLDDAPKEHSRHLYDLHMLYPHIAPLSRYNDLIKEVRAERRKNNKSITIIENHNIKKVLLSIIEEAFYLMDYNKVTKDLLYVPVEYEDIIKSVKKIAIKDVF